MKSLLVAAILAVLVAMLITIGTIVAAIAHEKSLDEDDE